MAQSRAMRVLVMSLDRKWRLIARPHSYRVQRHNAHVLLHGPPLCTKVWCDIQTIPRTQGRDDIPAETRTAISMFKRRVRFSGICWDVRIAKGPPLPLAGKRAQGLN